MTKAMTKTTVKTIVALIVALVLSALPLSAGALAYADLTRLVSAGPLGEGGDGYSHDPAISANGRYIAYVSRATDLIDGLSTNENDNIFLYDMANGTTALVTAGPLGIGGDDDSLAPSISDDGRWIAFFSRATDLIDGLTTNGNANIFLYDTETGITVLITEGQAGVGGDSGSFVPMISGDGTWIVFESSATDLTGGLATTNKYNIFRYDMIRGEIALVTAGTADIGGDGNSFNPSVSGDGRWVTFSSYATDLVDGMVTSGGENIYLYDADKKETALITTGSTGLGGNSYSFDPLIAAEGSKIIFTSRATDLVDGQTTRNMINAFLYDMTTKETALISKGASGVGGDGDAHGVSISADGSKAVILSWASNLVDNLEANGYSNIFMYDTIAETTVLISTGPEGDGGGNDSTFPAMSSDGEWIAYASRATDLLDGQETNNNGNIFVWTIAAYVEVTFDAQDGNDPAVDTVLLGTLVSRPVDPVLSGFVFNGWWTEAGALWDFDDPVTDDMTLYAGWTAEESPDPDPTDPKKPADDTSALPASGDSGSMWWTWLPVAFVGMVAVALSRREGREGRDKSHLRSGR